MNKQGKDKISWCDYTWNPVVGCYGPFGSSSKHNRCSWCYAWSMAKRLKGRCGYPTDDPFKPVFHEDRLQEPLKKNKPLKIFVASMSDPFGEFFHESQIRRIFDIVQRAYWHTFLFLTKHPQNLARWNPWPQNCWVGTTETCESIPLLYNQHSTYYLSECDARVKFISFEPLLGEPRYLERFDTVQWLIIGGMTGPKRKQHPVDRAWIETLVQSAYMGSIPVFMKNNIAEYWGRNLIQKFPL